METNITLPSSQQPDYEFHLPGFISFPLPAALICAIAGSFFYFFFRDNPLIGTVLGGICFLTGIMYVGLFMMIKRIANLDRRLMARDILLDSIPWTGSETVLDVGTGNGILLLAAAKRLTTGRGIGIDLWTGNSGGCSPKTFLKNAEIEGVADRITLYSGDARKLPFGDGTFDIVLSGLTIHHLSHGRDTENAISEIVRVLKPGGRFAVYDVPFSISPTVKLMRKFGMNVEIKTSDMAIGRKAFLPDSDSSNN